MKRLVGVGGAVVALVGAAHCLHAFEEQDAAKEAVNSRASLPLEAIVEQVVDADSEMLDARIERQDQRYRYRLKLLESGHRVRELVVDGRTGAILSVD